ncbi:MAG: MATE family efflux transporter [Alphaproteobacteria bacterium]|nr:MATE family efflux transporter [Alphaproteobacteria bacterium]
MNTRPTLLEGDPGAHIRRLTLPLAWGMLAMTSFSVFDAWFISHLGTKYLAAMGFTIPVVMFFMGIVFGTSVGTTSAIARVYGEGDFEKVRRMATDALSLTVVSTISASILGMLFIDPIFRLMGATPELMPLIHRYMMIWYCGLPFLGLLMVGNACIRATGDTHFVSKMMTLLAVSNIILDPFFIFGWGPFPEWKLAGAAATLVTSYYLTCCVSMYFLIFKKKILTHPVIHPGQLKSWGRILHVAVPSIVSNQIAPISAAIITWMAAQFGKEAVAALGVATRIESMATLLFYSMGAAIAIFAGQNYGAGNYGRIQQGVATGARYSMIWGLLLAATLWAFAWHIPTFFDSNEKVIAYTAQYLHWVPISYGALGVLVVSNAALNAMGKPLPATTLILLKTFVIYVPLAYVLQAKMGFTGILAALVATNFILGIISYFWNKKIAS